jgi:hypothetical protein
MPPAPEKKGKKKRGKPSDFQGARAAYLSAFIPRYGALCKTHRTGEIWDDVFSGYWAAFPWRLPLAEECSADELMQYGADPVNDEEKKEKSSVLLATERVSVVL